MATQTVTSVVGQGVRNASITTPWLPGHSWHITQGYGKTTDDMVYPMDHGTIHWHSGVDIGCDSGTVVVMPADLGGKAVWVDNPTGYGTALKLQMDTSVTLAGNPIFTQRQADIWLGHLAHRLVSDGQRVRAGDHLAITNCTGHCDGPHLHFEVRPPDGGYGTDVDPSNYLLTGTNAGTPQSLGDAIGSPVTEAVASAEKVLIGLSQAGLGSVMLLGGLVMTGFGLRGYSGKQAARATAGAWNRVNTRRPAPGPAQPEQEAVTDAGRTRLRHTLQRENPDKLRKLDSSPQLPMSSTSGPVTGAEERATLRAEQAATGQRPKPGAARRARARAQALVGQPGT